MGSGPYHSVSVLPTASYTGLTHEITTVKWLPTDCCSEVFSRFGIIGPWFLLQCLSMIICLVRPAGVPRARDTSRGICLLLTQVPTGNDNEQNYQNSRWLSPGNLA